MRQNLTGKFTSRKKRTRNTTTIAVLAARLAARKTPQTDTKTITEVTTEPGQGNTKECVK